MVQRVDQPVSQDGHIDLWAERLDTLLCPQRFKAILPRSALSLSFLFFFFSLSLTLSLSLRLLMFCWSALIWCGASGGWRRWYWFLLSSLHGLDHVECRSFILSAISHRHCLGPLGYESTYLHPCRRLENQQQDRDVVDCISWVFTHLVFRNLLKAFCILVP